MYPRNIQQFKIDFTGKDQDNFVDSEYQRRDNPKEDTIFITRAGPFYTESLVVKDMAGKHYVEDEDYEIFGIASELTAYVKNKEVGTMIKLINPDITEWYFDYQVVGHFSFLNKQLVNLIDGAINDERPVWYENIKNKPLWFNPKLHQHDIRYEIICFKELVTGIERIREYKKNIPDRNMLSIEHFRENILARVDVYEKALLEQVSTHDSAHTAPFTNAHGLTAKQVNLEKVDNFETATLLDVLDGFRKDLHVTADNLKKAIDKVSKGSENLVKVGSIPVIRYGSNSFIPTPIQGSFEGMGGTDFYIGSNIESNGDAVIMCPRNDGHGASLYFMNNTDPTLALDKWQFTAYKYTHPTADAAGVTLQRVVRGSNGKFLIVGGNNKSNTTKWYYAIGNGTLDPGRHKLIPVPDDVTVANYSYVCTSAYPEKVFVITRMDAVTVTRQIDNISKVYDLPTYKAGTITFDGANCNSDVSGFKVWEYHVKDKKWRRITFHYNQVGYTNKIESDIFVPFRIVVKEVSETNQRADGRNSKYGLASAEYRFAKLISVWNMRAWHDSILDLHVTDTGKTYFKYVYTSYGSDSRGSNFEGGTSSIGFGFHNRRIVNGVLHYDIENRKSLSTLYTLNTAVLGGSVGNSIVEGLANPHNEWVPAGYGGPRTIAWLGNKRMISIGTVTYGSYPASLSMHNFNGVPSVENIDFFADFRFNDNLGGVGVPGGSLHYNEKNAINIAMGAHSTFWLQLDPNDPDSYGCVSFSTLSEPKPAGADKTWKAAYQGLWFRKQSALDSKGFPIPPSKEYKLYEAANGGTGKTTLGYPLEDVTYAFTNWAPDVFCTNVFFNGPNHQKSKYYKHLQAHSSFPGADGTVNNSKANTLVIIESEVVVDGNYYTIRPTKKYDLDDAIKNILIPHLIKTGDAAAGRTLNYNNLLATHRIGFTNLRSTKYNNLLIFAAIAFDPDLSNRGANVISVAFNLSGGTLKDGIVTGAKVEVIGKTWCNRYTQCRPDRIEGYLKLGVNFQRSTGIGVVQPRDLVMQLENGYSHTNMQWGIFVEVSGNHSYAGVGFLTSEEGIIDTRTMSVYWTPGQYNFFHHPYYGLCDRTSHDYNKPTGKVTVERRPAGPSEIGWPYVRNFEKLDDMKSLHDKAENWIMGASNYLDGAFSVHFSVDQEIILNGYKYTVGSTIIDLTTITPNPRSKVFYVYIDYNGNTPYYRIVLTALAESSSRALIAIVKTNNESIESIDKFNVFTMNGVRISTARHGSAIPASIGEISTAGVLEKWID